MKIFVKYSMHKRLGVHLIHRHAKIAATNVILGYSFIEPLGR
jgi:hypothetical protein